MAGSGRHRAASRSPALFGGVVALLASLIAGILLVRPFGSGPEGAPSRRHDSAPTTAPARNRTTATSVTPSTSPRLARRGTLVIHGAGDVNVQPDYIGVSPSNYDFLLSGMNGQFLHDDLSVVNLECPASKVGSPLPKEFAFRCDPGASPF